MDRDVDLLRIRPIEWLVRRRWVVFALVAINLLVFTVVILSGLFGIPIGAKNFSIIFVWIVWWALLIILLVPLGARIWCAMCPIPSLGEWLQRKAILTRGNGTLGLGRKWPARLRNMWPANVGFTTVAIFSGVVTTRPVVTGFLLLGLVLLAIVVHLIYERRAFCRYLCPVGGFLGLYSMFAPLEIRRKEREVCTGCRFKSCFQGSSEASMKVGGNGGYGCPMFEFPGAPMERNTYCIQCNECINACPYDNLAMNLRPFGRDLLVEKRRKIDEAWKSFIMLGSALMYSVVMLGPWGWIKDWANLEGAVPFLLYAGMFVGSVGLALPGVHALFTSLSKLVAAGGDKSFRKLFTAYSYALVPLGLFGWIAFSFSFVLPNISYALPVLSDPFGWGWNLLGTRDFPWTPLVPGLLPYFQVPTLLLGLLLSLHTAGAISRQIFGDQRRAARAMLPLAAYFSAITLIFTGLYLA